MARFTTRRARVGALIALAAAIGLTAAPALLAHGGQSTMIHACAKATGGNNYLRVVDAGEACGPTEVSLDWNIAYLAGAGLTLDPATNTFSVTGVPWSALSGVPADLADGDDVGSDWDGLTNVPAGFDDDIDDIGDDWANLTNIPADISDGDDIGDDWPALTNVPIGFQDGTDDVGDAWDGLTGVPAGFVDDVDDVDGGTAADVVCAQAGCVDATDIGDDSVGSEELADGTVGSADLGDGAVTSGKVTANAQQAADPGGENFGAGTTLANAAPLAIPTGGNHLVSLDAMVAITCTCLTPSDTATVTLDLVESTVALTLPVTVELSQANPYAIVPITGLTSVTGGATHTFELRRVTTTTGDAGLTLDGAVVRAIDLGRQ